LLGCAILCGAFFVAVEKRLAHPMLPLDLFGRRDFTAAILVGLVLNFTLYGAIFVLGLYFQQLHGYSPLLTGVAFLPFCIVLGSANLAAGRLTVSRGARLPMVIGLVVGAVGYLALVPLDAHTPYVMLLIGLVVVPLGVGLAVPAMTTALLASVEKERSGLASGVLNTVRQAGGALGVAVLGSLLSAHGIVGIRAGFGASAALMAVVVAVAFFGLRAGARLSQTQA
jgi:MFS transporter, DHA2 family, methylenomycin A resistance protein